MKRLACLSAFALFSSFALALAATEAAPAPSVGQWLAGDLHVHDDHSSDGSLPRQRSKDRAKGNVSVADQIGQGERMGLAFMPLTDHRTFDQQYDPKWESSALLLIPGEEANGSPHAIALGGVDSIVQGAARADRAAFTHVQQSIWDAHAQGAVWSIAHPDDGETDKDTGAPNALANVEGMDLVEIWNRASDIEKEIAYSESRWNAGFRFGVAGASDSHFREFWDWQGPGHPTTRVLAPARNERAVIEGLRAGHTSLSVDPKGPMATIECDLGGHGYLHVGGDEIIARSGASGHLRIHVQHAAGLEVRLYKKPGRSVGALKTFKPEVEEESFIVPITSGAEADWYRVEVRGPLTPAAVGEPTNRIPPPAADGMELRAITSPIFISPTPVEAHGEAPIPRDQGVDDGAPLALGANAAFAGFPDVAMADGNLHLAAETHDASTSKVAYRRRSAKGEWSAEKILSGAGEARFPRVAAKGRDVWVVWQEDAKQVPHRPEIRLRHSADGGASWQQSRIIRALPGRAEHPVIAIANIGDPVIAWQEIRAGEPFDIMVQEVGVDAAPKNVSRAGKTVTPGEADDARSARYPASVLPALAVSGDGRIAIAWQDNRTDVDPLWTGSATMAGTNPDDWQIDVLLRRPDGSWSALTSLGASDMADRHPDVAFGAKGELVAVWESKALAPAGKNLAVLAAVSIDGGATFSAPLPLAPDPLTMSQRPRLGLDAEGAVRAVWYDSRSADWRWRVMTSSLRNGAWDKGLLLNGKGNNTWPTTSGGMIALASTRNASRLQRDATQQIFILSAH